MAPERRRELLLAALAVVLVLVIYRAWSGPSSGPAPASNVATPARAQRAAAPGEPAAGEAPDVHLESLDAERPKPGASDRDLFRFRPKAPPPPPSATGGRPATAPPVPTGPPQPPPLPPITLKFIGVMKDPAGRNMAVFSDGQGTPFSGYEGGVVAGRFRVLKIGEESVEIAYLDGRGRTTIRIGGGS